MAVILKFYAQKDALGFPIPGTMMAAAKVPAVSNVIEISTQSGVTVFKGPHPEGLRYYVRVDNSGRIIPNTLLSGLIVPEGAVELGSGNKCITLTVQVFQDGDGIELGLETYELDEGNYVKGTINWGDGSQETEVNVLDDGGTDWFDHPYATAGVYTITICIDRPDMIQDAEFGTDGNPVKLKDIRNFNRWEGVDELDLSGANIETFMLNGHQSLDELYIDYSTALTTVSVTNCPNLRTVDFSESENLTNVDFSGCPSLIYITFTNCSVSSQSLEALLTQLVNANSQDSGAIYITGQNMVAPTGLLLSHIQTLVERGWNVEYNQVPFGLTYPDMPSVITVGQPISQVYPLFERGIPPFTFSIAPALPDGMNIDMLGVISGTPVATGPLSTYTITASNDFGSTTATVSFSIVEPIPPSE